MWCKHIWNRVCFTKYKWLVLLVSENLISPCRHLSFLAFVVACDTQPQALIFVAPFPWNGTKALSLVIASSAGASSVLTRGTQTVCDRFLGRSVLRADEGPRLRCAVCLLANSWIVSYQKLFAPKPIVVGTWSIRSWWLRMVWFLLFRARKSCYYMRARGNTSGAITIQMFIVMLCYNT